MAASPGTGRCPRSGTNCTTALRSYAKSNAGHARQDITPFEFGKHGLDAFLKKASRHLKRPNTVGEYDYFSNLAWKRSRPKNNQAGGDVGAALKKAAADIGPLALGFLAPCRQAGLTLAQIKQAVDAVPADYAEEVRAERRDGMEKLAPDREALGEGGKAVEEAAPAVGNICRRGWAGLKSLLGFGGKTWQEGGAKALNGIPPLSGAAEHGLGRVAAMHGPPRPSTPHPAYNHSAGMAQGLGNGAEQGFGAGRCSRGRSRRRPLVEPWRRSWGRRCQGCRRRRPPSPQHPRLAPGRPHGRPFFGGRLRRHGRGPA
jgi:hypothetical protein